MKAIGALPTERRVQQMNDAQWLWFYLNELKDEEEEEKRWKSRLDYLTWFINPEMAKGVADQEKKKAKTKKNNKEFINQLLNAAGKQINTDTDANVIDKDAEDVEQSKFDFVEFEENDLDIVDGMPMGTFVNSEFDELLKQAVNENDVFIELPDTSDGVGDPNESLEDFVGRTMTLFNAFENGDTSVFAPENGKQDNKSPGEFSIEDLSHKNNSDNSIQINNIPGILDDDIDIIIPDDE